MLFNRMLGGLTGPSEQDAGTMRLWDFNISDNDKEIVVRAEVPGFEENELDVQINQDMLTIKAEKEQKGEGQEEYRSFYRAVMLPPGINPEKAKASYRNGVLELHIPKSEAAQPKRIKVQADQGAAASPQQGETANPQQGQQATAQKGEASATTKK